MRRPKWVVYSWIRLPNNRWTGLTVQFFDLESEAEIFNLDQLSQGAVEVNKLPYDERRDSKFLVGQ